VAAKKAAIAAYKAQVAQIKAALSSTGK
jgi:hypothetical protein